MVSNITQGELQQKFEGAIFDLLDLAKKSTFNRISENCVFILSEIEGNYMSFSEQKDIRKTKNDKKIPRLLEEISPDLLSMYTAIYDFNLYVYKSTQRETIIEIQYYLKSSLDEHFRKTIAENVPMLHCKVAIPPYITVNGKKEKFDINWEHNTLSHRWKMFWLRSKFILRQSGGKKIK